MISRDFHHPPGPAGPARADRPGRAFAAAGSGTIPFGWRLGDYLERFLFPAAPATRPALLRIFLGAYALCYLVPRMDLLLNVAQSDHRLFAPVGVVFGGPVDPQLFRGLLYLTLGAAAAFTLGLWHRVTGPAFAVLLLWLLCYRNSWSMIYHSDNLLALHAIILGFAPAAGALSVDSMFRRLKNPAAPAPPAADWKYGWPVKLMAIVTVSAYFVTAVAKLKGPLGLEWTTGEALRSQMAVDGIRKELLGEDPNPVSYALYDQLPLFAVLGAGSLALEAFAPLAVLHRRIGWCWAAAAYLMHWGIYVVMGITFRYQLSGLMFAPFFPVERLLDLVPSSVRLLGRETPPKAGARARDRGLDPGPAMPGGPALTGPARAVLFYDGECGLCDRFVQFVLRHDPREYFQFAPLQSRAGREQLTRLGLSETDLRTMVLVEAGKPYLRSSAALRVYRRLGGGWPLLFGFIAVPKPVRDAVYCLVARNRKRWFGSPTQCPVMPPEWRRRFIA